MTQDRINEGMTALDDLIAAVAVKLELLKKHKKGLEQLFKKTNHDQT